MVFEQLDTLKQQYTDKYVVVDAARPELARFRDVVGQVKTVNMSGRALVEFLDYHVNIGWFDIDPAFLKFVDKPAPKPKEQEAKKAAPVKPAAAAPAKPQAVKAAPAAGGKKSTADILAAARGAKAAVPASAKAAKPQAEEAPVAAEEPVVEKVPAPAKAAKATEKVDKSKMTVDEIIAWCRAHDAK